jgi:hypothetical protein
MDLTTIKTIKLFEDAEKKSESEALKAQAEKDLIKKQYEKDMRKKYYVYFRIGGIIMIYMIIIVVLYKVSFIICILTHLPMPLAGLHFYVGLDFVTPYRCNLF